MSVKKNKDIKLSDLLKEKFIDLDLQKSTKNKVIAELIELIAGSKKLTDKKSFSRAMQSREKLGSTGIGDGVAIPHAKSEAVKDFILVFARRDEGIDFDALDGEKTFLFFALASPKDEIGMHLKILSEISRLVKDKFIVELLKKAQDKKEVLRIITEMEKRLT
ncbi:MAG: PTS sugar transporter subunit IIA [Candidatus Omnitrophota bacterium]